MAPGLARISAKHSSISVRHTIRGAHGTSLYGRHALSMAKSSRFIVPHGARLSISRGVGDVGLGAARKFSSSGPLFAVIENVPILARAAYQVDWDVKKTQKENKRITLSKQNKYAPNARSFKAVKVQHPVIKPSSLDSEEFDVYFPKGSSTESECTTTLIVPLHPTRQALGYDQASSVVSIEDPRLLDFPLLSSTHSYHTKHRLRISTLFSRLDSANVWAFEGVACHPFALTSARLEEGQATHLKVIFPGWPASRVRKVIGDSGLGWCELSESVSLNVNDVNASAGSMSPFSDSMELDDSFEDHAIADTFILPTIDLTGSDSTDMLTESSDVTEDRFTGSESEDDLNAKISVPTNIPTQLGFSANFLSGHSHAGSWDSDWTNS